MTIQNQFIKLRGRYDDMTGDIIININDISVLIKYDKINATGIAGYLAVHGYNYYIYLDEENFKKLENKMLNNI